MNDLPHFSEREAEFLTLFCAGKTRKEIVASMGLRPGSIPSILSRIRDKIGEEPKSDVALYKWILSHPSLCTYKVINYTAQADEG